MKVFTNFSDFVWNVDQTLFLRVTNKYAYGDVKYKIKTRRFFHFSDNVLKIKKIIIWIAFTMKRFRQTNRTSWNTL